MSVPPSARRPAGVEPLRVPTRRGALAALAAGDEDMPAVVLVPGFTGSKEDFLPLLPLLAGAGMRPVAYDQLGQFESPRAPSPEGYELEDLASDLVDVLSVTGGGHVVGHSFGGHVAAAAAIRRPDLFRSLVLLDSGPGALPAEYSGQLQTLVDLVPVASMAQIWDLKEALDREAQVPPPPPDVHEFLHHRWLATDAWCLRGMARWLLTAPDRTGELDRALRAASIPVAVAYGVDDSTSWPIAQLDEMARRLGVPPVAIPDAAHSPAVENPDVTGRELVTFLTSALVHEGTSVNRQPPG